MLLQLYYWFRLGCLAGLNQYIAMRPQDPKLIIENGGKNELVSGL